MLDWESWSFDVRSEFPLVVITRVVITTSLFILQKIFEPQLFYLQNGANHAPLPGLLWKSK